MFGRLRGLFSRLLRREGKPIETEFGGAYRAVEGAGDVFELPRLELGKTLSPGDIQITASADREAVVYCHCGQRFLIPAGTTVRYTPDLFSDGDRGAIFIWTARPVGATP